VDTPYCSAIGECGECKVNADCANSTFGSHCFIETEEGYGGNYCAGCTTDSECKGLNEGVDYCSDIHECQECITHDQCPTGKTCLTDDEGLNYCAEPECETNDDCYHKDKDYPYCSADHTCVGCLHDANCDGTELGGKCISGYCGGCKSDTDCADMNFGNTPYCSAKGICEECTKDSQCDSDYEGGSKCYTDDTDPYDIYNYCDYDY